MRLPENFEKKMRDLLKEDFDDYIACYESGEGISFAIESGYHQANAIINDMEAETVSIPIRDAFCGEVKKLDKEPLVRQDLWKK